MTETSTHSRAVELGHHRDLVRHLLSYAAGALFAAAAAMVVMMAAITGPTGDFPGRWLIAAAGCVAAGLVLQHGARNLPAAPRLSSGPR
jgi:peptidoglycan/LPS O-acetylase OafA/YrhL